MIYKSFVFALVVLTCLVAGNASCYAQESDADTSDDFIPRQKILFEDDFSNCIVDAFPLRWSIEPCDAAGYRTAEYCHVRKIDGHNALVIIAHEIPFGNIIDNFISPVILGKDYLPDSFTIQYDFLMSSAVASPVIYLSYTAQCFLFPFRIIYKEGGGAVFEANIPSANDSMAMQHERTYLVKIPGTFNYKIWHNLALSFDHGAIKCYLDKKKYGVFLTVIVIHIRWFCLLWEWILWPTQISHH